MSDGLQGKMLPFAVKWKMQPQYSPCTIIICDDVRTKDMDLQHVIQEARHRGIFLAIIIHQQLRDIMPSIRALADINLTPPYY